MVSDIFVSKEKYLFHSVGICFLIILEWLVYFKPVNCRINHFLNFYFLKRKTLIALFKNYRTIQKISIVSAQHVLINNWRIVLSSGVEARIKFVVSRQDLKP